MISTQSTIKLVDLNRQYEKLKEEIDEAIQSVVRATDFINGQEVKNFAEGFAQFCEVKHCIPCANGTDALEIGMKALGIGPGDEVIVPANTFIACSEAIGNIGAEVVFCDALADSYNIDPESVKSKITSRTKAIMPVHLYGRMADMDPLVKIAKDHGLFIIEDASQAHGAAYKGTRAGNFGDFAVFSFYPGKNLGAYGDAGAIVTNNEELFTLCKKIANHGRIAKYNHEMIGRNSRMDTIQAAVLNVKLRYLQEWSDKRYKIAQLYHEQLRDVQGVITPADSDFEKAVYHLYVIRVAAERRDALKKFLHDKGIETGIHYPIALPQLQAYDYLGHRPEDFPVSNQLQHEILSLPLFPEMEDAEIVYVCNCVREFMG